VLEKDRAAAHGANRSTVLLLLVSSIALQAPWFSTSLASCFCGTSFRLYYPCLA
jgi:hypothetical protein